MHYLPSLISAHPPASQFSFELAKSGVLFCTKIYSFVEDNITTIAVVKRLTEPKPTV